MTAQTQAGSATIGQLIINSPYDEPREHWSYHRETRLFTREPERRKAGYVRASEKSRSFDDPGIFIELPLVNQIRPRVKAWRESDYPGASGITKRLLQHWRDTEQRDSNRRFFFCQLEAIETLIWLTEAPASERVAALLRQGRSGSSRRHPAPRDEQRLRVRPGRGKHKNAATVKYTVWQISAESIRKSEIPNAPAGLNRGENERSTRFWLGRHAQIGSHPSAGHPVLAGPSCRGSRVVPGPSASSLLAIRSLAE